MKISFCTSCAQRLYQLEQTWEHNIDLIKVTPDVEWVLLNYDGDIDMHNFVLSKQSNWPKNFIYANQLSKLNWHMSVAKNISHQLGSGEILFNLDCDNFIGNAIDVLNEYFVGNIKLMHMFSGIYQDGTSGRIAIGKKLFYDLGGYDESLYPMAGQDADLLIRSTHMGYPPYKIKSFSSFAIKNTKIESVKLCVDYNLTWENFFTKNKKKMEENIQNGKFVANQEKGMTKPNVEIFRGVTAEQKFH